MRIGIVDDEPQWGEKIEKCIENYFLSTDNKDYDIRRFCSGKDFLKDIDDIELLFLDVELADSENGFEIAEFVQNKGFIITICFLTSHTEFARVGYRVNAFRYIDKLHLEEIDEAIAAYINTIAKNVHITCKTKDGAISDISICDVIFIEKNCRKIIYHMSGGEEYYGEGKLSDIAARLNENGFVQTQRSYVVNMRFIKNYDSRNVMMLDGTQITIGRDRLQALKKEFFDWRRNASH